MKTTKDNRTGSILLAGGGLAAAALALAGGPAGVRKYVRKLRDDHQNRPALWNRLYALDWGETTTNNYGFAPADGNEPQRFQHQMYREMLRRLQQKRPGRGKLKLLEVSCGRGGGLKAFVDAAKGRVQATGLDVAQSAIHFCQSAYAADAKLQFVQGNALELPFPDKSFDAVLNVEASNDYPDRPRFFAEVARVLKDDGLFLYTDSFRTSRVEQMKNDLAGAGFAAEFDDITANVAEACALDTPRRLKIIDRAPLPVRLLFSRQLRNYAAVEGSDKYQAFVDGRRAYLMTAATKS